MESDSRCEKCKFIFTPTSQQYYCCNINERYCILCRTSNCRQCSKMINKQVVMPRCRECYGVAKNSRDMLYENQCDSYFCGKCIVTRIMKRNRDRSDGVTFPCGHMLSQETVQSFLRNFCMVCGCKWDPVIDYELLNGGKACFMCVKYESKAIGDLLIQCMSCGETIKRLQQAGTLENDFILCNKCVTFSKMEEKHFQSIQEQHLEANEAETREKQKREQQRQEQQKREQQKRDKQSEKMEQMNKQPPNNDKNSPVRRKPIKIEEKPVQDPPRHGPLNQQKYPAKSPRSPAKQIIPNIEGNIEQCQIPTSSIQYGMIGSNKVQKKDSIHELKKTILNKFPSEKQPKMKKHMSMDTYVEKLHMDIECIEDHIVTCAECEYEVSQSEAFDIENEDEVVQKYCRLCFTFLAKNEYLGFTLASPNRRSLDASRNRGASNKKQSELLAPQASDSSKFGKLSGHFQNHERLYSTTSKPINYQQNLYKQKCQICKKSGVSMIRTVSQGQICFECYYQSKAVQV